MPTIAPSTRTSPTPALFASLQNSPPRVVSAIYIEGGKQVGTASVQASVLGADDSGEANLRYIWTALSLPKGAKINFSDNGTNTAKKITIGFERAGVYVLRATIMDPGGLSSSSTISVSVVPTLSQIQLLTTSGSPILSSSILDVTRTDHRFQIRGVDQFGNGLTNLSGLVWTTLSAPAGGTVRSSIAAGIVTQSFSRAGAYRIRASFGNVQAEFSVNVISTLSSLRVTAGGNPVTDNARINTGTSSQSFSVTAVDQYGTAMAIQPSAVWSTTNIPSGATLSSATSGNNAVFTASRIGVYGVRVTVGTLKQNFNLNFTPALNSLQFQTLTGSPIGMNQLQSTSTSTYRVQLRGFDQFGTSIAYLQNIVWSASSAPSGGKVAAGWSNGSATLNFNRVGTYIVSASIGGVTTSFTVNVTPTPSSLVLINGSNQSLSRNNVLTVGSSTETLYVSALDQFGIALASQPIFQWSLTSVPIGSTSTLNSQSNTSSLLDFDRVGVYGLRITTPNLPAFDTRILVKPVLSGLGLSPGTLNLQSGQTAQFTIEGRDQFNQSMDAPKNITWSCTGGTISSVGLYSAGSQTGTFTVTASSGGFSATVNMDIVASSSGSFSDAGLATMIATAIGDGSISRSEMIGLLRSVGADGTLSNAELSDLRTLVSDVSYSMPEHVRELAKKIVFDNSANLSYQGQTAGNVTAGSSQALLDKLIDKWFFGTDVPTLTSSAGAVAFEIADGLLFGTNSTAEEPRVGALNDTWFISGIKAVMARDPNAIRDAFIDNGDGTFTVRFYGGRLGTQVRNGVATSGFIEGVGTPDYVTVDRSLPATFGGTLVYAQAGLDITDSTAVIWPALLEKAYAQWSESGNAGRNPLNSYASLESGWMSTLNAHLLGKNSINRAFSTSNSDVLIAALNANRAVTLGTKSTVTFPGLVASRAYVVTGYDRVLKTFSLSDPTGSDHPAPMTWSQLAANATQFCVVSV
jgi:hypothetical protein